MEKTAEVSQSVKIKDKSKDLDTLNKFSVNYFIIKCRSISEQGKVHVLKRLLQHAKRYRQKRTKKEEEKEKNARKAERFVQEVMFMKKLHPDEITKFSLLNKKTFKKVGDDPKSSIEERALCRLAEHKSVSAAIVKFRDKYPEWDKNLPYIVKGLGFRHRKEKLKRLQEKGKMDTYLEKEQNSLKLLHQVGVLKLEKRILDHGDKIKQPSNIQKDDDLKNRPFNMHSQNNSIDPQKSLLNKGSVDNKDKQNNFNDLHKAKTEDNEEISDEGLGSSEEANNSTRLHLEEKEADSEEDIMVEKLGQNKNKSADDEESWESGDCDENEQEGDDEDSDNENEEESDDSEDDSKVGNLGQTLKSLVDNDESDDSEDDSKGNLGQTLKSLVNNDDNDESNDSEDDNIMADLGQTLKKLADNVESSECEGDSNEDDENESEGDENSDSEEKSVESTDDENESNENNSKSIIKPNKKAMNQKYLKKINKKASLALLTKNTKNSRTVEVKTLDLSVVSNIGIENRKQDSDTESESEDEEFFKRPNKEGKIIKKKKKNKSSFFLREGGEDDDDNESDAADEGDEGDENYLKRQREDSDDGNIDTGKYFRANIYRSESGSNMDRGRGGRGGLDRGRGRGFDRGGGRGFDRGGGRGFDRGGGRGLDRGRGRGFGNNKDTFDSDKKESSGFEGRGRGFNDKRRGSGRGSGERGRPDRNFKNKGNEFNANYIDIDPKNDYRSNSANKKGSGPPMLDVSTAAVHPSWAAKQKLKQQSAGLNSFAGKRTTFD